MTTALRCGILCFSALQRAENSSILDFGKDALHIGLVSVLFSEPKIPQFRRIAHPPEQCLQFQCSSASRKFLKTAANHILYSSPSPFQCSSASRKFLKGDDRTDPSPRTTRFQCSSASRKFLKAAGRGAGSQTPVFQCSSASRKFLKRGCCTTQPKTSAVSVLFSEPKIPQIGRCL